MAPFAHFSNPCAGALAGAVYGVSAGAGPDGEEAVKDGGGCREPRSPGRRIMCGKTPGEKPAR
jgi:hypothetical protein